MLFFAVLIIYSSYYATYVNGWIVSALINLYRGGNEVISISSISLGVLGGRVFLEDVQYITEDFSIKVMQLSLRVLWWQKQSGDLDRMTAGMTAQAQSRMLDHEARDGRLSISLYGVELLIFNSQSKVGDMNASCPHRATDAPPSGHRTRLFVPYPIQCHLQRSDPPHPQPV